MIRTLLPLLTLVLGVATAEAQVILPVCQAAAVCPVFYIGGDINAQNGCITLRDGTFCGAGGGGGISGSGSTGFIPRFTGSTAIGNSVLRQSGSNIGLGVSPSFAFDVLGDIHTSGFFMGDGSQLTGITMGQIAGLQAAFDQVATDTTTIADNLAFYEIETNLRLDQVAVDTTTIQTELNVPATQVPYGTGSSITSDSGFTRDSSSNFMTVIRSPVPASATATLTVNGANSITALYQDPNSGTPLTSSMSVRKNDANLSHSISGIGEFGVHINISQLGEVSGLQIGNSGAALFRIKNNSTRWDWMTADSEGFVTSNGSGVLALTGVSVTSPVIGSGRPSDPIAIDTVTLNGFYSATFSVTILGSWIPSGDNYYVDLAHNLNIMTPFVVAYDSTNTMIYPQSIQALNANTVRITVSKTSADGRFDGTIRIKN